MPKSHSSYGQILKSSSIIGGAQAILYVLGLVRTKLVAVLIGPAGVGLVGLYGSTTDLITAVTGLGIGSSAVRQVAEAHATGDAERVSRTVKVLRRVCWLTGSLGWVFCAALAWPLSHAIFGGSEHAWAIAALGAMLLLGALNRGQIALVQGMRRIGDLARFNVLSAAAGTVLAIVLYALLGMRGIVPVLLLSAAINLAFSWRFARRIPIIPVPLRWVDTWREARRLVGLGLAFMWTALLGTIVALVTGALILRRLGLDANGSYQAAWAMSGLFAGFILSAMGADFYPRITGAAHDHPTVNRLVNEQTEIAILLALPGLLGTLAFAPWLMRIFYSAKFLPGAELLPWFVVGILGRVVTWPLVLLVVAQGAARTFATMETAFALAHLALTVWLLHWLGLWGVALAFAILYAGLRMTMLAIANRLTGFRWSTGTLELLGVATLLTAIGFATQRWTAGWPRLLIGASLTAASVPICIRGIAKRLGPEHSVVRALCRIPGMRATCGAF